MIHLRVAIDIVIILSCYMCKTLIMFPLLESPLRTVACKRVATVLFGLCRYMRPEKGAINIREEKRNVPIKFETTPVPRSLCILSRPSTKRHIVAFPKVVSRMPDSGPCLCCPGRFLLTDLYRGTLFGHPRTFTERKKKGSGFFFYGPDPPPEIFNKQNSQK